MAEMEIGIVQIGKIGEAHAVARSAFGAVFTASPPPLRILWIENLAELGGVLSI